MKNVADIWPLAPLQELMLAHALADETSQLLVEQFQCTICGTLDVAAFEQAWDVVVERHALLRTGFAWEGLKKPVQVVRKAVELSWTELDCRPLPDDQSHVRRDALLREAREQGFDLTRPPLMRFHLARTGDREWQFAWTCHHLALDGWSVGIVLREVFETYAALCAGRPIAHVPAGTFADYLKWLPAQDLGEADEFWRGQLEGSGAPLPLPYGEINAAEIAEAGHGQCELRFSQTETSHLVQAAQARHNAPSAMIEAAWAILLARHAECDDVLFGVAVSGRPPAVPRVETIVGPFTNNVPRRVKVSHEDSLAGLCQRLHQAQVDVQPFEHCSLEQIAKAAGRTGGRLFDSLVVYENYPLHGSETLSVGELTVRDMQGTTTSSYPLTLVALPGRELMLRLLFDRRRYDEQSTARLLDQLASLLRGSVDRPDAAVRDLALVDKAEVELLSCLDQKSPLLRVLDSAQQPTPLGMPGHLWVAEMLTAAGRINQQKRAASAETIVDPLDPRGVRRLRDTAYLGAQSADGEIEFLGPAYCRNAAASTGKQVESSPRTTRVGRLMIDPAEVEAVLSHCPLIDAAVVVAYRDGAGRNELAAYLVPAAESSLAVANDANGLVLAEARQFMAEHVPAAMIPRAWRALTSLPRNEQGDIHVAALPSPVSPRNENMHPCVAPRNVWEQRVAAVWSQVLGVEPVGVTDSFMDLGGHSSLAVALLARLEEEFGRRLPLAALFEEPTVEHLARLLRATPTGAASTLVVPIRPAGTQPPLFCIHPAGGTVFCYLELAQHIDADVPLYGIQAQGIEGTLAPHESIAAMAVDYVRAIKMVQPAGPYHVCGWSTGGVVAFEVARQLHEQGDEVALVGLIDAAIPDAERAFDENDLVPMLQMMFPTEDADRLQQLRELPIEKQVEYFQERAQGARLLLAGANARGARAVYDVFEANMKAVVAYEPAPSTAPLLLIRAADQATPMHADPLLGWGAWAAGEVTTCEVSGSHLTMLQAPAVVDVAKILNHCLGRASHSPNMASASLSAT